MTWTGSRSVRYPPNVLDTLLGAGSTGTFNESDIATDSPITSDLNRSFAGERART
jgi:hypothetical protein